MSCFMQCAGNKKKSYINKMNLFVCVCVCLYFLLPEYQNTRSPSKVRTFLIRQDILAGPPKSD